MPLKRSRHIHYVLVHFTNDSHLHISTSFANLTSTFVNNVETNANSSSEISYSSRTTPISHDLYGGPEESSNSSLEMTTTFAVHNSTPSPKLEGGESNIVPWRNSFRSKSPNLRLILKSIHLILKRHQLILNHRHLVSLPHLLLAQKWKIAR